MLAGIGVGFLIGLLGLFWLLPLIDLYEWYFKLIFIGLCVLTFIISITICVNIGIYEDRNEYLQYIDSYNATKEIYEKSINNKNLSDLEKINLVSKISSLNSELAKKKIEYKKWYYKIDYSLIEELKPIDSELLNDNLSK